MKRALIRNRDIIYNATESEIAAYFQGIKKEGVIYTGLKILMSPKNEDRKNFNVISSCKKHADKHYIDYNVFVEEDDQIGLEVKTIHLRIETESESLNVIDTLMCSDSLKHRLKRVINETLDMQKIK